MGDAPDDGARRPQIPPLLDATIEQLHEGQANDLFTSVDLVNVYITRINEVNEQLRAVTEINPEALKIAVEKDGERKKKTPSSVGLLHGIPILLKNSIATSDQMNNTAGSYALLGAKVPRDATVVQKLREAGAIILGKANLSQWSNARSSNSSNGWSAHGGQVYGAYVAQQDACGSSSGSAVASSIALAAAALGVETDGSITCPVGCSNVVSIKPTVGLTSRYLVIPVSEHQDTVGSIARTVKDAATVLQTIAGIDPADKYTNEIPNQGSIPNYVSACTLDALKGARLGIPDNVITLYQDKKTQLQIDVFNAALERMQSAGATIIRNTDFPAAAEYLDDLGPTKLGGSPAARADFIVNIASYFKELSHNPNSIRSLQDLRAFTHSDPREQYPDRNTAEWDKILAQGWDNTSPKFQEEYDRVLRFGEEGGLLGTLKRYDLDAVVLPTSFAPRWAAMVGTPIVTVPLGAYPEDMWVEKNPRGDLVKMGPNFPFGISFLGTKWSEEKLIGYAYAFEQMTKIRENVKPLVQPKTELQDIFTKRVKNDADQLPEMPLKWIQNTELIEVPAGAKRLLEDYGKVPPDDIKLHINQVRARALKTFPYPCLGHYRFLDIQIAKSRTY